MTAFSSQSMRRSHLSYSKAVSLIACPLIYIKEINCIVRFTYSLFYYSKYLSLIIVVVVDALFAVICKGTEDRVSDPSRVVGHNSTVIPYVNFPGPEIKDLFVHDEDTPTVAAPAPSAAPPKPVQQQSKPPPPPQQQQQQPKPEVKRDNYNENRSQRPQQQQQQQQQSRPQQQQRTPSTSVAGTGAHLKDMRVKGFTGKMEVSTTAFNFEAGLSVFNKEKIAEEVAGKGESLGEISKYKKDDFFDSLSCEMLDRQQGRLSRMAPGEERNLNKDTFGAIGVQSNNYR